MTTAPLSFAQEQAWRRASTHPNGDLHRGLWFRAALDPEALQQLLAAQLRERSDRLPVLDLGAVLRLRIFGEGEPRPLALQQAWVAADDDRLSIDARVE